MLNVWWYVQNKSVGATDCLQHYRSTFGQQIREPTSQRKSVFVSVATFVRVKVLCLFFIRRHIPDVIWGRFLTDYGLICRLDRLPQSLKLRVFYVAIFFSKPLCQDYFLQAWHFQNLWHKCPEQKSKRDIYVCGISLREYFFWKTCQTDRLGTKSAQKSHRGYSTWGVQTPL